MAKVAIGLAGLMLVAVACGGIDPGTWDPTASDQSPIASASASYSSPAIADPTTTGGDSGSGNGGIGWPQLPEGPDIPETLEIQAYKVLAAADASRCAALFSPGGVQVGGFVVSLVAPSELNFVTGDRTRHLYEAGAHLCAGDETAATAAFAAAVSQGPWDLPAEDPATQQNVCHVWNAVADLLDTSAGVCTLEVTATDDGDTDADATDDPSPSDDSTGTGDDVDATDAP